MPTSLKPFSMGTSFFKTSFFALETSATVPTTMPIYYICIILFFSPCPFTLYKNKARLPTYLRIHVCSLSTSLQVGLRMTPVFRIEAQMLSGVGQHKWSQRSPVPWSKGKSPRGLLKSKRAKDRHPVQQEEFQVPNDHLCSIFLLTLASSVRTVVLLR